MYLLLFNVFSKICLNNLGYLETYVDWEGSKDPVNRLINIKHMVPKKGPTQKRHC